MWAQKFAGPLEQYRLRGSKSSVWVPWWITASLPRVRRLWQAYDFRG